MTLISSIRLKNPNIKRYISKKKLENMNVVSNEKIHIEKAEGNINIGDDVFIKSLNKTGTVVFISSNGKECTVKMGVLSSQIKIQ